MGRQTKKIKKNSVVPSITNLKKSESFTCDSITRFSGTEQEAAALDELIMNPNEDITKPPNYGNIGAVNQTVFKEGFTAQMNNQKSFLRNSST